MILITGASGNVGREVLKQIAPTGVRVRAGFQSVGKVNVPSEVEVAVIDYNQVETLREALQGVDRVFLVGPPTAELTELERNAIDVIKQSAVQQVVKLSAMGGRESIFPRQHAESEDYIRSCGVPYTFLRPNGFMQNMINYNAPTITRQNAFYGTEGDGRISQIDIRDVAAVALKVLRDENAAYLGQAYTLTGPEALTNSELAAIMSEVLGRKIQYINLPPQQFRGALLSAGVPEWSADALLDLERLYREGPAATVTDDVKQILGRKPIHFAQFVRDYQSAFELREQAAS